jgi:hypothetical protein
MKCPTPSELKRELEQLERDSQIREALKKVSTASVGECLFSLQEVLGALQWQGLLNRRADVSFIRLWLAEQGLKCAREEADAT